MRFFCVLATLSAVLLWGPARAETNVLVILDGSNSMWGQIDGVAKMETAKDVLSGLVSDMPAETGLGLMAYGHSAAGDCKNVEVLQSVGGGSAEEILGKIKNVQPTGKTPIAYALTQAEMAFAGREDSANHILLVSDGVESCGGDPCAAAQALADAGLNVKAHVVGFGLASGEGEQLTCIASNTGGQYFDAADASAFKSAIEEVVEITQAPPEPDPEPVRSIVFEDEFDGAELSDNWSMGNPDPDAFILEDGELILLATTTDGLANPDMPNILAYQGDLPNGDWVVTVTFTPEFHTAAEALTISLFNAPDDRTWVNVMGHDSYCCDNVGNHALNIILGIGRIKGESASNLETPSSELVANRWPFHEYVEERNLNAKTTIEFIKEGRTYFARLTREGHEDENGDPVWTTSETMTLLRAPETLALNAWLTRGDRGDALFKIDRVVIEKVALPDS